MAYAKLTVDHFAVNLKDNKYAGITGARRAIGKVTGWSDADRKRAHGLADAFFGTSGEDPHKMVAGKAAKKVAKKLVAAPKTAKKAAKRELGRKTAKKAARAPRASAPTTDPTSLEGQVGLTLDADSSHLALPLLPRMHGDDPATVRQLAASTIIAALHNSGTLGPREQRTFVLAQAEYEASVSPESRQAALSTTGSTPEKKDPKGPKVGTKDSAAVVAAPPSAPHIDVPEAPPPASVESIDLSVLSPKELAEHNALTRAAVAAKVPIPPVTGHANNAVKG